jgi:hypothetical protein
VKIAIGVKVAAAIMEAQLVLIVRMLKIAMMMASHRNHR